jgi:hypothetical protein
MSAALQIKLSLLERQDFRVPVYAITAETADMVHRSLKLSH